MPNEHKITAHEEESGNYGIDRRTVDAIRRELESASGPELPESQLPSLSREEAIAQARAALKVAEQKHSPDQ